MDRIFLKELEYCFRLAELKSSTFSTKTFTFVQIRRYIERKTNSALTFYFLKKMIDEGVLELYHEDGKKLYIVNIRRLKEYLKSVELVNGISAYDTFKQMIISLGGTVIS